MVREGPRVFLYCALVAYVCHHDHQSDGFIFATINHVQDKRSKYLLKTAGPPLGSGSNGAGLCRSELTINTAKSENESEKNLSESPLRPTLVRSSLDLRDDARVCNNAAVSWRSYSPIQRKIDWKRDSFEKSISLVSRGLTCTLSSSFQADPVKLDFGLISHAFTFMFDSLHLSNRIKRTAPL